MFWYILNRAGIINEPILDLKKDETLRKIYNEKFNQVYDLGFVNIISRPTRKISLLKKNEEVKGRRFIISIIKKYSPIVVCFIGKSPYEKFIGSKDFDYGWQKNIYQSKVFVMHFPIRGKASIRISELKKLNKKG